MHRISAVQQARRNVHAFNLDRACRGPRMAMFTPGRAARHGCTATPQLQHPARLPPRLLSPSDTRHSSLRSVLTRVGLETSHCVWAVGRAALSSGGSHACAEQHQFDSGSWHKNKLKCKSSEGSHACTPGQTPQEPTSKQKRVVGGAHHNGGLRGTWEATHT